MVLPQCLYVQIRILLQSHSVSKPFNYYFYLHFVLVLPSVEDLKVKNNGTTVTLSWSPPIALAPKRYKIDRSCQGISDSVEANTFVIVSSSPHHSTDVPPYSQCTFDLIGLYGNDSHYLARSKTITGMALMFLTFDKALFVVTAVC